MMSSVSRRLHTLARNVRGSTAPTAVSDLGVRSSFSTASNDHDAPQTQKDLKKHDINGESFIQRGKRLGANALLGYITTTNSRFDTTMKGLNVVKLDDGWVRCEMTADEPILNSYGTVHGGALSTIIDVTSTIAIMTKDVQKAGVSVELNLSFVSAAKKGEEMVIEAWVSKLGGKLAFTQVDIRKKSDGKLVATGRHTKAV